jgi:hypothetical protein
MLGSPESKLMLATERAGLGLFAWATFSFTNAARAPEPSLPLLVTSALTALMALVVALSLVRRSPVAAHRAPFVVLSLVGALWIGVVAWRLWLGWNSLVGLGLVVGTMNWITWTWAVRSLPLDGELWTPPESWKQRLVTRMPSHGRLFLATVLTTAVLMPTPAQWLIDRVWPSALVAARFAGALASAGLIWLGIALYLHDFDFKALGLDDEPTELIPPAEPAASAEPSPPAPEAPSEGGDSA